MFFFFQSIFILRKVGTSFTQSVHTIRLFPNLKVWLMQIRTTFAVTRCYGASEMREPASSDEAVPTLLMLSEELQAGVASTNCTGQFFVYIVSRFAQTTTSISIFSNLFDVEAAVQTSYWPAKAQKLKFSQKYNIFTSLN